jgi:putative transposase
MKTLEFALHLNSSQQATLNGWLESLRWVWNEGVRLCLEFDRYSAWDKQSKTWSACCPRFGDEKIRWIKDEGNWIAAPYSPIATRRNPTRLFCPLPPAKEYRQPHLPNISEFSLASAFAHKRHPDKPWLKAIPANFIRGVTQSLNTAWQRYKKGEMGEPRFKGKSRPLETLTNNDAKIIKRDGDRLMIPNLGWLRVRDLTERFGEVAICTLKICKRPSGWYVQLTGDLPQKQLKPSNRVVGVAFTDKNCHHITDNGKRVEPPRYMAASAKKLARLQCKLSRQQFLGQNWEKTKQQIGRLHEKIRLQRRNFNHKLSTYLVRTYGAIAVQQISHGPKRRPEPKVVNGEYAPNGALERTIKNRYLVDLGTGQFVSFIQQKVKDQDRTFAAKSTPKGIATAQGVAERIRSELVSTGSGRIYPECAGEVMPVKGGESPSVQQEPGQPGHASVAGTTQSSTQGATTSLRQSSVTSAQTIDRSLQNPSESPEQGFPRPP